MGGSGPIATVDTAAPTRTPCPVGDEAGSSGYNGVSLRVRDVDSRLPDALSPHSRPCSARSSLAPVGLTRDGRALHAHTGGAPAEDTQRLSQLHSGFLTQMCARFSPQQVSHAVERGCGCARARESAVKSSIAQSTAACAGPAFGGGPARRQPVPPQGAEALAFTGQRTMNTRGTRPGLSPTFYRWAEPSLTVQPLELAGPSRFPPCTVGRTFRAPAVPLQIQTVFSSHVSR